MPDVTDESLDGGFALALTDEGVRNVIESILMGAEEPLTAEQVSRVAGEILEPSVKMALLHTIAKMAMAGKFLISAKAGLTLRPAEVSGQLSKPSRVIAPPSADSEPDDVQEDIQPPAQGWQVKRRTYAATEDDRGRARELWEAGRSIPEIAAELGFSRDCVRGWSEKYHWDDDAEEEEAVEEEPSQERPRLPSDEQMAKARQMYEGGKPIKVIAEKMGRTDQTIYNWARRWNWAKPKAGANGKDRETRGEDFILEVGISVCESGVEVAAQEHGLPVATVERLADERGWVKLPYRVPDPPLPPPSDAAPKSTPRRRCEHCDSLTELDPCGVCARPWEGVA